jgi:hypothetical protein
MTSELRALLSDRGLLSRMALSARQIGRPKAADVIARDFLQLVGLAPLRKSAPPTGGEQAHYKSYEEVA